MATTTTTRRERRFLLIDLTPGTRNLFRVYRDASRAVAKAGERSDSARRALVAARQQLDYALGEGVAPGALRSLYARLDAAETAHIQAEVQWRQAVHAAEAAFHAARPAMEAEGYPYVWWHSGVMRLPAGVDSPGVSRRDRARRHHGRATR